jgi:DMSO/TMAO reductase YedYZ molybdopterin-dependent catalytic subunit
MTDKTFPAADKGFDATRRKSLKSLAAIGVSGVGAGLAGAAVAQTKNLSDGELKQITTNPDAFFKDPNNRSKALGISDQDLKIQLNTYAKRNNLNPQALIKEIIKTIEP